MKVLGTGATGFLAEPRRRAFTKHFEVYCDRKTRRKRIWRNFSADLTDAESFQNWKNRRVEAIILSGGVLDSIQSTAAPPGKFGKQTRRPRKRNLAAKTRSSKFISISSVLVYGTANKRRKLNFRKIAMPPDGDYAKQLETERVAAETLRKTRLI